MKVTVPVYSRAQRYRHGYLCVVIEVNEELVAKISAVSALVVAAAGEAPSLCEMRFDDSDAEYYRAEIVRAIEDARWEDALDEEDEDEDEDEDGEFHDDAERKHGDERDHGAWIGVPAGCEIVPPRVDLMTLPQEAMRHCVLTASPSTRDANECVVRWMARHAATGACFFTGPFTIDALMSILDAEDDNEDDEEDDEEDDVGDDGEAGQEHRDAIRRAAN